MKLHYGEEFEKVHEIILNGLKQESAHGLILLHGLPGSGKTSLYSLFDSQLLINSLLMFHQI